MHVRGDVVHHNLIFNSCRESGDHGPINSWSRQPFLTDFFDGTPSFRPVSRKIAKNFIFANYGAGWAVDNDDGSSWYEITRNVFYASQVSAHNVFSEPIKYTDIRKLTERIECLDPPGFQDGLRRA